MKTVIVTIKPSHLRNIFNGIKEFEVRKTFPHIPTPFRVLLCESGSCGEIKGEFICDRIDVRNPYEFKRLKSLGEQCCISLYDALEYAGGKMLYLWHIRDFVNYCNTKGYRVRNISEYGLKRPPQSWQYIKTKT